MKKLTAQDTMKGCKHDGSFIPVDECERLMHQFAVQEVAEATRWRDVKELPEIKEKPYQILVKSSTGFIQTYWVIDQKSLHFLIEFKYWQHIK